MNTLQNKFKQPQAYVWYNSIIKIISHRITDKTFKLLNIEREIGSTHITLVKRSNICWYKGERCTIIKIFDNFTIQIQITKTEKIPVVNITEVHLIKSKSNVK